MTQNVYLNTKLRRFKISIQIFCYKLPVLFLADIPCAELSVEANGFYGSKATIKSMVFSCPSPEKVQWQKSQDKRVFLTIDITVPEYIGSRDVPKSAILVIPKISFDDKLFYRLVVWNKIGQNYSNIIYLNVTGSMN